MTWVEDQRKGRARGAAAIRRFTSSCPGPALTAQNGNRCLRSISSCSASSAALRSLLVAATELIGTPLNGAILRSLARPPCIWFRPARSRGPGGRAGIPVPDGEKHDAALERRRAVHLHAADRREALGAVGAPGGGREPAGSERLHRHRGDEERSARRPRAARRG